MTAGSPGPDWQPGDVANGYVLTPHHGWQPSQPVSTGWSGLGRGVLVAVIGTGLLVLGVLSFSVAALVIESRDVGADGDGYSVASDDDHQICVLQLTRVTAGMADAIEGSDPGAYDRELRINGYDDRFYQAGEAMAPVLVQQSGLVGWTEALADMRDQADETCTEWGNPIRPNYPV